ncbi:Pho80p cyclin [Exophiala xenobiotica]|nr:Pho80p cyclin [Exophiala xenobiotica]KAK5222679.1 Pho80p cyclin [Exophiala xenobiotica]KAK5233704.1 Pho80p cyclin [Exophiala xenobiotica]KAK5379694.1 Pho80p cyclin [Exophiala xenobiotica]KAK5485679.1 Pho80p cyclin [Exophiala xenobiotica]
MLATSPSPSIPARRFDSAAYSPRPPVHYDQPSSSTKSASRPSLNEPPASATSRRYLFSSPELPSKAHRLPSTRSLDRSSPPARPRVKMVDAATQYSPPQQKPPASPSTNIPTSTIAGLQLSETEELKSRASGRDRTAPQRSTAASPTDAAALAKIEDTPIQPAPSQAKRSADEPAEHTPPPPTSNGDLHTTNTVLQSPVKKARPDAPPVRIMPLLYETCNTRDLVVLISSMLMELIRYNDAIPLREGQLTRFHSRAPPGISVLDYLQRLTTHATLSPPILLSVVYYIDRLCTLYPAFTISSLTVHRFLITSATVASKGLSDSFWTNKTYARVGGVSMKELALLELEFLQKMEWRIVPQPETLVEYYKNLIERSDQYQLQEE